MKNQLQRIGHLYLRVHGLAGRERSFTLEIDPEAIVSKLSGKAASNKSGVSRIVSGAVVVREVRQ